MSDRAIIPQNSTIANVKRQRSLLTLFLTGGETVGNEIPVELAGKDRLQCFSSIFECGKFQTEAVKLLMFLPGPFANGGVLRIRGLILR